MAKDFSKRLERLEQLARNLVQQTVAHRFLPFDPEFTVEDYLALMSEMIEQMVSAGEILPGQRVGFSRWWTRDEDDAARAKAVEAERWAPSREALAGSPPDEELGAEGLIVAGDSDLELERKFTRPLDEIVPFPEGIV